MLKWSNMGRGLLVFLEPLTKGSRGLSYIFIFTLHPSTFVNVDDHHGVLIFRVHQEDLDGSPSLEEHLHTKVTAFFLDTFTQPLIVWNSYVGFGSVALLSVLVLLLVLLGWIVQPNLHPVQSPSRVVAVAQCSVQMFFFLLQALIVGAYGFSPVEEGSNNPIFECYWVMTVPLKILVCEGWLPIYCCSKPAIFVWTDQNVQER